MNGSLTNTRSIVERSIMLVTPSSETPSALFTWSPMKAHNIQEQQGRLRTRDHETSRLSLFHGHNYETLITRWMHPRHRRAASLESGELSRVMQQPLRYTRWCRFVGVRSFIHARVLFCLVLQCNNKNRICLIVRYRYELRIPHRNRLPFPNTKLTVLIFFPLGSLVFILKEKS